MASSTNASGGQIFEMRPILSASSASIGNPVKFISIDFDFPAAFVSL
uniref:Uncharacterized protein n=1 Tax=Lepeophtheirus salmonis TaxID=72036 RepID=A0A0K2VHZ9_LEPSM